MKYFLKYLGLCSPGIQIFFCLICKTLWLPVLHTRCTLPRLQAQHILLTSVLQPAHQCEGRCVCVMCTFNVLHFP